MKTFEDIERLGLEDAEVCSYLELYLSGSISKEGALIGMVITLQKSKTHYLNECIRLHNNSTQPMLFNRS